MSRGTIERIICDHLKLKKITARWVPNLLTDNQRAERVRLCQENLAKFQQGTWRLCDVVTGDESWFYHKQIGRKSSNAAWTPIGWYVHLLWFVAVVLLQKLYFASFSKRLVLC